VAHFALVSGVCFLPSEVSLNGRTGMPLRAMKFLVAEAPTPYLAPI
jgi:hypothetical protein